MHEVIGRARIAAADKPARQKFRVGIKRNPCPSAARSGVAHFLGQVFVFGINERPDFIALNPFAIKIAESFVLILGTRRAELNQKFLNRRAMNARHADSGAERIAFNQTGNHPDLFFFAQFIHKYIMLERSRFVKCNLKHLLFDTVCLLLYDCKHE